MHHLARPTPKLDRFGISGSGWCDTPPRDGRLASIEHSIFGQNRQRFGRFSPFLVLFSAVTATPSRDTYLPTFEVCRGLLEDTYLPTFQVTH